MAPVFSGSRFFRAQVLEVASFLQMIRFCFLLDMTFKHSTNWDTQWKMNFNPDTTKQAQKVIFRRKLKKIVHPPLLFNNVSVTRTSS